MTRGTTKELTWKLRDVQLLSLAQRLQDHYCDEYSSEVPYEVVVAALEDWLELHLDRFADDLPELLSNPARVEAAEFRQLVEKFTRRAAVPIEDGGLAEASVFTGNRVYSFEKLAAMTAYVAAKGRDIYKTKLNKLLFYSDFINYYLYGSSISGSRYIHLPYGPVPDRYEPLLNSLSLTGTIQLSEAPGYQMITAGEDPLTEALSQKERSTIDWVLQNLGPMSASEISEFSHREKAYKNTRPGEHIAYDYAKFFQKLPNVVHG